MKLKICGMKYPENVDAIRALAPDYLGFIFHPTSARYMPESLAADYVRGIETCEKVGVFVNHSVEAIALLVARYDLDFAQLHGQESPEACAQLKALGIPVIKVFSVGESFDFSLTAPYEPHCAYFLFDTKGKHPGGNGLTFDWQLLRHYTGTVPFFLSGGIGPEQLASLRTFSHPMLHALDVNSRFETEPGRKDPARLHIFQLQLADLRTYGNE